MSTVVIRLRRANLPEEMAAMRAWLDENRCQPSRFMCDQYEDMTVLRVEFKQEKEADAFREKFDRPISARRQPRFSLPETREPGLVPEGWFPTAMTPESMLQVCRWRIMAEEVRAKAESLSTRSAKETLDVVAQVWDQMAENLEKRLNNTSELRR